jgi:hypothetical protein
VRIAPEMRMIPQLRNRRASIKQLRARSWW